MLRGHAGGLVTPRAFDPRGMLHGRPDGVRYVSTNAALVGPKGDRRMVISDLPLARVAADGDPDPVDLTLEPTSGGFEPVTPVMPLELPLRLDDGMTIGDGDIRVAVEPGRDGNATGSLVADGSQVFYPNVRQDTDKLVAPFGTGVEELTQLRSIDSPEDLTYDFASLRGSVQLDRDASGAITATAGGDAVAALPPITATDAAGAAVPVQSSVDGSRMTVHIAHRDSSFAYPIMVDPRVEDVATDGQGNYTRGWKYCSFSSPWTVDTTTQPQCVDDLSALAAWAPWSTGSTRPTGSCPARPGDRRCRS